MRYVLKSFTVPAYPKQWVAEHGLRCEAQSGQGMRCELAVNHSGWHRNGVKSWRAAK